MSGKKQYKINKGGRKVIEPDNVKKTQPEKVDNNRKEKGKEA